MAKKRSMNELRQTKDTFYKVPTHDPQTGELNPHYKILPNINGHYEVVPIDTINIGSEGVVESEIDDYEEEIDDESNSYHELIKKLKDLRKQYSDDKEFGYHVAKELL